MKIWALLFLFAAESVRAGTVFAPVAKGCGDYDVAGVVVFQQHHLVLKVHNGSQSETTLDIPAEFQGIAAPYPDHSVVARGKIRRPIETYRGTIELQKMEERVPDPLHPTADSGFNLVKRQDCEKP